ncbi:aminoglycoside phosphotransferase family protein [Clavibacter sp. Sh2126]|uniref:aminoglycoside phosphotransferase family protein n=1 Tax=Clavibacter sp. Sh2126 TaxID=3397678 RepID=UPI0039E08DEF
MTGAGERASAESALAPYRARWRLDPDGAVVVTPSSVLAPVRRDGARLMLKVPLVDEERRGSRLLAAWSGRGAVRVHAADDGGAVLMSRAEDPGLLVREASAVGPDAEARDERATRILVRTARRLHSVAVPDGVRAEAVPLATWARELLEPERPLPRAFDRGRDVLRELLGGSPGEALLHGDVHHGNVLRFGDGDGDGADGSDGDAADDAWRAIDPKALRGDPGFDTAYALCNPTLAIALRPGRLARRAAVIAEETGRDLDDVLAWAEAWCALSAAWDVGDPSRRERVAALGRLGAAARALRPARS